MLRIVAIITLLVVAISAENMIEYAGSTSTLFSSFVAPTTSATTGACQPDPSGSQASYVHFTVTFATSGVREVAVIAEQAFKSNVEVFIYSGTFSSGSPCNGLYSGATIGLQKQFSFGGGPVIDDFIYFTGGTTYTFVVTGSEGNSGLFSLNIFPSIATGQITPTSATWFPVYDVSGGYCYTRAVASPYATFTWTQATTGFFDIYALFSNSTVNKADFDSYLVIYQGTPSSAGIASDPCNSTATNANLTWSASASGSKGAYYPYANLIAGSNYTAVFSSDNGNVAFWGVQVIPTRIRFFQQTPWTQPAHGSKTLSCSVSDNTNAAWDSTVFVAEHSTYLIDTSSPPSPFSYRDTYSFLYLGNNSGNPPATCPASTPIVISGDTGDITPVYTNTISGKTYTVIVSTYDGENVDPGSSEAYVLYLFTGTAFSASDASSVCAVGVGLLLSVVLAIAL